MILKRLNIFLLFLLVCTLQAQIVSANNSFDEANAAYSRGNFEAAIDIYEQILEDNGYAPGVLYNLANSYAMTGQTGLAILNYERALRLAPGNSDITGNLQLLRTKSGLFATETTFSERLLHLLSIDQWTLLGGLALLTLSATLLLSLWLTIPRKITLSVSLSCLLVIIIATLSTAKLHSHWNSSVVITDSRLQVSPFEGAAGAGEIQQGRMIFTLKKHDEYVFVQDTTERQGWIPSSAVRSIIPR